MTPLIILTLVLLWQFVLVGYTYTLAGNAADKAVNAATAAHHWDRQSACRQAGSKDLPGSWAGSADINCHTSGNYVTADVHLKVPVLFPGSIAFPFHMNGHAGAVEEEVN
ncbi:pilus assembly protein [Streptomyces sp. NPDC058045]|uniref:pilus assembly protein n=1 Tax=Streptomyces sp. NPDC058045 TaxID=3346311 RepID=UPI0036ED025F